VDRRVRKTWQVTYRGARRVVITVVGVTVIVLGVAMLVLPGPGLVTIVGGLAILALEFAFAKRWLERIKSKTRETIDEAKRRMRSKRPPDGPSGTS
jgi:tellurite resistance protein TerC